MRSRSRAQAEGSEKSNPSDVFVAAAKPASLSYPRVSVSHTAAIPHLRHPRWRIVRMAPSCSLLLRAHEYMVCPMIMISLR
jgi:hypothetical protein